MTDRTTAEKLLSEVFDSQMLVSKDGCVTFTTPAQALKDTVQGNPNTYKIASALMAFAESGAEHE